VPGSVQGHGGLSFRSFDIERSAGKMGKGRRVVKP